MKNDDLRRRVSLSSSLSSSSPVSACLLVLLTKCALSATTSASTAVAAGYCYCEYGYHYYYYYCSSSCALEKSHHASWQKNQRRRRQRRMQVPRMTMTAINILPPVLILFMMMMLGILISSSSSMFYFVSASLDPLASSSAAAAAAATRSKFAHPSAPRPPTPTLDISSSSSRSSSSTTTLSTATTPTLVTGYGSRRHYRRTHHHHHRHGHQQQQQQQGTVEEQQRLRHKEEPDGHLLQRHDGKKEATLPSAVLANDNSGSTSSSLWIEDVSDVQEEGGGLRVWVLAPPPVASSKSKSNNNSTVMIRILPSPLPYQQQQQGSRRGGGGGGVPVWNLQVSSISTSSSTIGDCIHDTVTTARAAAAASAPPPPPPPDRLIPVQGLYGVYQLASGQVWVWIARSNVVYAAPGVYNNHHHHDPPWFQIYKVQELVLHHVPYTTTTATRPASRSSTTIITSDAASNSTAAGSSTAWTTKRKLTRSQQKEEHRQLALLRQALKDHDWYYATGTLVPDLTRNLQSTLLLTMSSSRTASSSISSNSSSSLEEDNDDDKAPFASWWKAATLDYNNNNNTTGANNNGTQQQRQRQQQQHPPPPDSRFFWNQALLEPLLQQATINNNHDSSTTTSAAAAATAARLLLDHAIPITSAFCGVQRNQTIGRRKRVSSTTSPSASSSSSSLMDCCFYDQVLLTRRSRFRAGTRFTKRGADATGAVANYAETEQMVFLYNNNPSHCDSSSMTMNHKDDDESSSGSLLQQVCSHVQTRGSIPLRWSSPADIKTYRPRVRIGIDPLAQARAMRQHLAQEAQYYMMITSPFSSSSSSSRVVDEENHAVVAKNNPLDRKHPAIVLVNLVDQHSDQGRLGQALEAVLKAVLDVYSEHPDDNLPFLNSTYIRHVWYDFHALVKGGRWDRLQSLLENVQAPLHEQAFFRATVQDKNSNGGGGGSSIRTLVIDQLQTGVIRTNCMDCLDRTNVVQGIFSRSALFAQLSPALPLSMKTAFRKNPLTLPWKSGEVAHRHLWADNADAISRLYSGTAALKRDFTRTGKRTKKGALDDGMNSLQRYFLNNFLDADRQEGIDLLTRFQEFSNVYDAAGDDDDDDDGTATGDVSSKGMTIQEAARQLLLGQLPRRSKGNDHDDADHVRIKIRREKGFSPGAAAFLPRRKSPVDLLWLPGDLQTQMRDLASSSSLQQHRETDDGDYSTQSALEGMDRRAADPFPWWMVASDASSDEESDASSSTGGSGGGNYDDDPVKFAPMLPPDRIPSVQAAAGNSSFLMAALLASARAPLATAVLVVALTGLSLASTFANTPSSTLLLPDDDEDDDGVEGESDDDEEAT